MYMSLSFYIFFGYILILPEKVLSQVNGIEDQPARDCSDIWKRNNLSNSGIYTIRPDNANTTFQVFCEMSVNGGYTLIQRHNGQDGLSFDTTWNDYENGFGNLGGEHWLGLKKIYVLTQQTGRPSKLRISIGDFDGKEAYAEYDSFSIGNATNFYRLSAGIYSGTAGDALAGTTGKNRTNIRGSNFSTEDNPNDRCNPMCLFGDIAFTSCSEYHRAGWWFNYCGTANLNGVWRKPPRNKFWASSVSWPTWRPNESLKFSKMYLVQKE
ncbi:fibrinogen-like protein 1 [Rhinoderma darwinii]|uniref:fibrinogen-like protein 1 n=1 Tax=Rhinoderma darwinii TaxID=43563 RepID=UPI003F681BA6